MLTVSSGSKARTCDGVSRRNFLQLGAMTVGGLTLAQLLQLEAQAGVTGSQKALINIHLGGGPSHQDMFDLKPEAPREFRGEFNPISTNVSGMQICEHMPTLATMADKFAVIRSLVGMYDDHSNFHTQTGYGRESLRNVGGRPAIGSVVSKLVGSGANGSPAFVAFGGAPEGYLGPTHKAYNPGGGGDLKLSYLTEERLGNRTNLLSNLDRIRRDVDSTGKMSALDSFTERAVSVVTSGKVAEALDLSKEDDKVRQRYGREEGRQFLTARRLVEAGVRVVSFDWGGWDTHSDNFTQLRRQLPQLDKALSALISDIYDRGLANDVAVVMWGEFGRTPRVNNSAGRDHWSRVQMAFLAGGGMKMGQMIGSTTKNAEEAKDRPVDLQEVFATLYHHFGLNVEKPLLTDPSGRPQYLVDRREVIKELVS